MTLLIPVALAILVVFIITNRTPSIDSEPSSLLHRRDSLIGMRMLCKRAAWHREQAIDGSAIYGDWRREQMECELDELCRFFGTTPDAGTFEAKLCEAVIYRGMPFDELLQRIEKLRSTERNSKTGA